jgi:uncharacterized membrane-anchored protein YhcB (DUF1043 family)
VIKMNDNLSNVEISVQELKLLVNTLTKSVALSLRKRHTWLGVVAGLLIGSCLTLAIIGLTGKNTYKITATTQTLLEKSRETISELKQINSKIAQLAQTTHALNEKKQTDDKISASTDVGKTSLSAAQNVMQAKRYTVYLHYTNEKNKKLMERFSVFLNNKGFKVAGIQKVNYHNQDVRYFHDEDKEGALVLKKQLTGFITPFTNLKDINIKIINLSSKFPNAQKGALELWVNF